MKFLLELATCCGLCSSGSEGIGLLVVPETRRRVRRSNRGRLRGGRRRKWRPSLSSISEESDLVAERINNINERVARVWRKRIGRKVSSMLQRYRTPPLDYDNLRRGQLSRMVPTFAPTPFMF